jgi:hypothetical protein
MRDCYGMWEVGQSIGAGAGWDTLTLSAQSSSADQLPTYHNNHAYLRLRSAICAPDDRCSMLPSGTFCGLVVSMLPSGTFGGLVVNMLASGTFGGLVVNMLASGTFGGLVVNMLASGTRVRGFKPDRSRRKNPQHAFL